MKITVILIPRMVLDLVEMKKEKTAEFGLIRILNILILQIKITHMKMEILLNPTLNKLKSI